MTNPRPYDSTIHLPIRPLPERPQWGSSEDEAYEKFVEGHGVTPDLLALEAQGGYWVPTKGFVSYIRWDPFSGKPKPEYLFSSHARFLYCLARASPRVVAEALNKISAFDFNRPRKFESVKKLIARVEKPTPINLFTVLAFRLGYDRDHEKACPVIADFIIRSGLHNEALMEITSQKKDAWPARRAFNMLEALLEKGLFWRHVKKPNPLQLRINAWMSATGALPTWQEFEAGFPAEFPIEKFTFKAEEPRAPASAKEAYKDLWRVARMARQSIKRDQIKDEAIKLVNEFEVERGEGRARVQKGLSILSEMNRGPCPDSARDALRAKTKKWWAEGNCRHKMEMLLDEREKRAKMTVSHAKALLKEALRLEHNQYVARTALNVLYKTLPKHRDYYAPD